MKVVLGFLGPSWAFLGGGACITGRLLGVLTGRHQCLVKRCGRSSCQLQCHVFWSHVADVRCFATGRVLAALCRWLRFRSLPVPSPQARQPALMSQVCPFGLVLPRLRCVCVARDALDVRCAVRQQARCLHDVRLSWRHHSFGAFITSSRARRTSQVAQAQGLDSGDSSNI